MFTRTVHSQDLERLRHEREATDLAYNDALTRLDAAIRPLAGPPGLGSEAGPDDPATLVPLAARAPVAPPPRERFWRRWLRRLVTPVVLPALERQAELNRALVGHLTRAAAERREERRATERLRGFLGDELDALASFQSRLVQYAQQITPYIDTRNREAAALLRRITEDSTVASAGVAAGLEAVAAAQRGLDDSFDLLQASVRVMKREVHRLRSGSAAPEGVVPRPAAGARAPGAAAGPGGAVPAPAAEGRVSGPAAVDADGEDEASAYVSFEDVFRGAPGDIAERQRAYLDCFAGASDVLDIGCGRGEFLELLRERGIAARGIDTNPEMVARCVERGLSATRADALSHLSGLPEEAVGGIFSAQVVEHLEAAYLVRLTQEMHRVLRPGGRAVVETINPTSWIAFFSAYLRDITHRQPLHPDTLEHLLRAAGFRDVRVAYSSPPPAAGRLERVAVDRALAATPAGAAVVELAEVFNRNVDRLNDLVFADQDYAVIATRGT